MRRIIAVFFSIVSVGMPLTAFPENFESSSDQQPVTVIPGWSGDGIITTEECNDGKQSLRISTEVSLPLTGTSSVQYIDLWLKPRADESQTPEFSINLGGAKLAFVKEEGVGAFFAYNASSNEDIKPVLSGIALQSSGIVSRWYRLTVRIDRDRHMWDLFVDGVPRGIDLKLDIQDAESLRQLSIGTGASQNWYLDSLEFPVTNPLFNDEDGDGMPDAFEVAFGMNPKAEDRLGDADRDGVSNIYQFLTSGAAVGGTTSPDQRYIFVDQNKGKDSNTGLFSYSANGDGPKKTIRAAMSAAVPGATIVVMEGMYDEGVIDFADKPINMTVVGKVKM